MTVRVRRLETLGAAGARDLADDPESPWVRDLVRAHGGWALQERGLGG